MIPPVQIYDQDMAIISNDLLPVKKRKPIHLNWLKELLSSCKWLHDLIFENYAKGSTYPDWVNSNVYNYLNRVVYLDGAVYELQAAPFIISIIPPNIDTTSWIKVLDSFVGARERANYTGQKLSLEFILNRRFKVVSYSIVEWEVKWIAGAPVVQAAPPYTQIYITQNNNFTGNFWLSNRVGLVSYLGKNVQSYFLGNAYGAYNASQFTVWVPAALYAIIGSYQPAGVTADTAIRAVINNYANAGSIYTITQY